MIVVIPNITMSRTDEHVYADYYNVYFGQMEEVYGAVRVYSNTPDYPSSYGLVACVCDVSLTMFLR